MTAAKTPGVTSEQVASALAQLDNLVEQTLERTNVPGMAVVVVHGDLGDLGVRMGARIPRREGAPQTRREDGQEEAPQA